MAEDLAKRFPKAVSLTPVSGSHHADVVDDARPDIVRAMECLSSGFR